MKLTEREREEFAVVITAFAAGRIDGPQALNAAWANCEAILAARLAKVEALAEEWERLRAEDVLVYASRYIADLRAALDADVPAEGRR